MHDWAYVDEVRRFTAGGGKGIEADTIVSPPSFEVACHAVGAVLTAVDAVVAGNAPRAVCLIRPPGHDALPRAAMGFCLFNNVALAAAYALKKHGLNRVLIVDWDVHHGNGTQDVFYDSGSVYFLSIHRSPFYPGTGAAHETGTGAGLGTKFNLPVRFGTPRPTCWTSFKRRWNRRRPMRNPVWSCLRAGFNAHAADPIGSLGL